MAWAKILQALHSEQDLRVQPGYANNGVPFSRSTHRMRLYMQSD